MTRKKITDEAFEVTPDMLDDAERKITRLERSLEDARTKNSRLSRENKRIPELEAALDFATAVESSDVVRPNWTFEPTKVSTKQRGIVSLLLSDLHLDEVVNPDEIEGVNAYNREIAELRIQKTVQNLIQMIERNYSTMKIDGIEILFGGDLVTGNLHDLQETNDDYILGTVVHWVGILAELLEQLRTRYTNVIVRCVVGNHGRNTMKPRTKGRVRDNFDWLIVKMLEREFRDRKRVTFDVPESADVRYELYDVRYLGTHGDQFRGGNGIAGIFSAVLHGQKKKLLRTSGFPDVDTFDVLWHGHFHQSYNTPQLIGNGSLKGYDEYAYVSNFGFEVPSQSMWVTTPEHGLTAVNPLFSLDRKAEGW